MRNYLLLTPGPLSTSQKVREAMLQDWCTWDKDYNEGVVMKIRNELLEIAGLKDDYTTVLLQGSGTYGVEATLGSAIKDTYKLLIISNGAYGNRMGEMARYLKLDYVLVNLHETQQVTKEIVEEALTNNPGITHLAVVHCETTTGIINPIEEISEVVKKHNLVWILDAMSSFGGIPIDMEKLGIDFLISSANKCIQGVPGFSFVICKKEQLEKCKGISRSLSLDLYAQWEEMEKGKGKWRFTSPTHVVRAFEQALNELEEEGGISKRYERYKENHDVLVKGMREAGFKTLLEDELQSPIITSFLYPNDSFSFQDFYNKLKERGFVIYPGKISDADTFRIGNIGDVFPTDFVALTQAIKEIYK
ncbi:MAG: 2-aminoethylphosphonate--pyruvate transaminase [Odoribacter sp.]|nr:2-aminoethylphosphonate--pyruvate transaminase [Odoribacter sp.]